MQANNKELLLEAINTLFEQYKDESSKITLNEDFQQALANVIDSAQSPVRPTETKNISILLSDLRGFTAMAEKHSALTVIELLNRYFTKMSEIIDSYGGTIDKFMGDSIMVLFGADASHEEDVENALACAIEMQIAMNDINAVSESMGLTHLYMGIGINTGEVVTGTLGSDIYREYTVIGDHVNLASRVEAHSMRGQVLISENTYKLAKDNITIGDVNEVVVKGKRLPVKMYEVLSVEKPKFLELPIRDNRKSPRVEVNLPLNYKKIVGKQILSEVYEGKIIDISYGGFFTRTDQQLAPLSEIIVTVSLSLMGTGTSDIYARVLNATEVEGSYQTHLEFTSIDENAKTAIKAFVDRLI